MLRSHACRPLPGLEDGSLRIATRPVASPPRGIATRFAPTVFVLLATSVAQAGKSDSPVSACKRVQVRNEGVFLDVPANWLLSPAPESSRMLVKEYPMQLLNSNVSIQVFAPNCSFEAQLQHHKRDELAGMFPGGTIQAEETIRSGALRAVVLRIGGMKHNLQDFEAMDATIDCGGHFLLISMLHDRTRRDKYDPIFRRMVTSITSTSANPGSPSAFHGGMAGQRGGHIPGKITWRRDLESALELARQLQAPILVSLVREDPNGLDPLVERSYTDPNVIELSRSMVCLVASRADHRDGSEGADVVAVCPRFGAVTCAEHVAVEASLPDTIRGSNASAAAQHVLLDPDGTVLNRRERTISAADLRSLMRAAISAVRKRRDLPDPDPVTRPGSDYLKEPDESARMAIIQELLGSGRTLAMKYLISHVADSDDGERVAKLLEQIGRAGHPDGVPLIAGFIRHSQLDLRRSASMALEEIASPSAIEPLTAQLKIEGRDAVKGALIRALAACGKGSSAVAKTLLPFTRSGSLNVRVEAVIALRLYPREEEASAEILRVLGSTDKRLLQAACAWTLGYLRDRRAEPLVARLVADTRQDELSPVFRAARDRIAEDSVTLADYEALLAVIRRDGSTAGREGFVGHHR